MTYTIGKATFYPKLNLIRIDNREVTLDFNEVKIFHFLLKNKNKVISVNKIKNNCYFDEGNVEDIVKKTIKNLQKLINSHSSDGTILLSFASIVYFKFKEGDKSNYGLLKRLFVTLSIFLIITSVYIFSHTPKREYVDQNLDIYSINNNGHTVKIINNINNNINNNILAHLKKINNQDITLFYFENENDVTFSVLKDKNVNIKSHVINKSPPKLLLSELDRVLKL